MIVRLRNTLRSLLSGTAMFLATAGLLLTLLRSIIDGGKPPLRAAEQARLLLREFLKRAHLSVLELSTRTGLSVDVLNSAYLRMGRKTVYTEPQAALAVVRALAPHPHAPGRCRADEALRFFDLTQVPPSRYAEVKDCFPADEWNAAVQGLFTSIAAVAQPAAAATPPTRFQLRAPTPHFVGRAEELALLLRALGDAQNPATMVQIVGMPGVGKTDLALMAGGKLRERFPDGQLLIRLHNREGQRKDAAELLRDAIRSLSPDSLPANSDSDDLEFLGRLLRTLLAERRVLIVLDDATEAGQVRALLPPAGSALLVTSRYHLALPEAVTVELRELPPAEALALFTRICARGASYAEQIVARCGHLPLAITLAASLLKHDRTLSVARFFSALSSARARLRTLISDDQPEQSVAAVIQVSVGRLDPAVSAIFGQLAVFPDSFDSAAALAVVAPLEVEALEAALSTLYRSCLLRLNDEEGRYELHDLVRDYALTYLEQGEAQERHAAYFAGLARRLGERFREGGAAARVSLRQFDQEGASIEAGWEWARQRGAQAGRAELELEYALATLELAELRHHPRHTRIPRLETALPVAARFGRAREQGAICGALARAWLSLGESGQAESWFAEQRRMAAASGAAEQQVAAAIGLGEVAHARGAIELSRRSFDHALAAARAAGDRAGEALAQMGRARADQLSGELDAAQTAYDACLAIARGRADVRGELLALNGLGRVALDRGRLDEAEGHFSRQLRVAAELDDRHHLAEAHGGLGYIALERGQLNEAGDHFARQRELAEALGDRRELADARGGLGHVALRRGRADHALAHYEAQLALNHELSDERELGYALGGVGAAHQAQHNSAEARRCYERWREIAARIGHRKGLALASWRLGRLLVREGDPERGLALMADRVAYERTIGHAQVEVRAAELEALRAATQEPGAGDHIARSVG